MGAVPPDAGRPIRGRPGGAGASLLAWRAGRLGLGALALALGGRAVALAARSVPTSPRPLWCALGAVVLVWARGAWALWAAVLPLAPVPGLPVASDVRRIAEAITRWDRGGRRGDHAHTQVEACRGPRPPAGAAHPPDAGRVTLAESGGRRPPHPRHGRAPLGGGPETGSPPALAGTGRKEPGTMTAYRTPKAGDKPPDVLFDAVREHLTRLHEGRPFELRAVRRRKGRVYAGYFDDVDARSTPSPRRPGATRRAGTRPSTRSPRSCWGGPTTAWRTSRRRPRPTTTRRRTGTC